MIQSVVGKKFGLHFWNLLLLLKLLLMLLQLMLLLLLRPWMFSECALRSCCILLFENLQLPLFRISDPKSRCLFYGLRYAGLFHFKGLAHKWRHSNLTIFEPLLLLPSFYWQGLVCKCHKITDPLSLWARREPFTFCDKKMFRVWVKQKKLLHRSLSRRHHFCLITKSKERERERERKGEGPNFLCGL